jgi:hypothetical protein
MWLAPDQAEKPEIRIHEQEAICRDADDHLTSLKDPVCGCRKLSYQEGHGTTAKVQA